MNYKAYITSIFAGVLASIAWIENSSGILMILAFSLFVHLYHETVESGDHHTKVFQVMLPGFLVYNLLSFSWLHKVSVPGAIAALMINTFMMASVFWVSGLVHRRTGKLTGFMTLIAVWLVYEHLTTVVPVFSPWLNPGNAFGNSPELVQWYEYTGTGGGSLWIMLSAIMIYLTYTGYRKHKWNWGLALLSSSIIIIPVVVSLTKYFNYREKGIDTEIVIVQPNIDPYKEKFGTMSFTEQLDKMLEMAAMNTTDNTDWIIFPETSIDDPFKEVEADSNKYIIKLKSFISDRPMTSILAGITTTRTFTEKPGYRGNAAQRSRTDDSWYEIYNSATALSTGTIPQFYHKSKLVPGIEQKLSVMPAITEKFMPELGGTMSGYGTQATREVFENPVTGTKIAPVICYESVFGRFITDFVRGGAEIICIITNDGWWRYTAGYRQHLQFASLRAIETRRDVVRCANTGISGLIDQKGKIIERSAWWEETTMRLVVKRNDQVTFYTKNGDFIYRYADIFTVIIFILTFIGAPLRKYRYK